MTATSGFWLACAVAAAVGLLVGALIALLDSDAKQNRALVIVGCAAAAPLFLFGFRAGVALLFSNSS